MRPVTRIAFIGIAVAVICLPLAGVLQHWNASQEARATGSWWGGSDWLSWADDWGGFGTDAADDSPVTTRQFSWTGADQLQLDVPATVHFHPAAAWTMSIRGPSATLDRLSIDDGRVHLRRPFYHRIRELEIELSGPALRRVVLNGSGNLALDGIQQDTLRLDIHGSAEASASGTVGALELRIRGSGDAHLAPLQARSADIYLGGSGSADINCSDAAEISIAGSGNVRLHSHPRQLRSRVHGSGEVIELSVGQTT